MAQTVGLTVAAIGIGLAQAVSSPIAEQQVAAAQAALGFAARRLVSPDLLLGVAAEPALVPAGRADRPREP